MRPRSGRRSNGAPVELRAAARAAAGPPRRAAGSARPTSRSTPAPSRSRAAPCPPASRTRPPPRARARPRRRRATARRLGLDRPLRLGLHLGRERGEADREHELAQRAAGCAIAYAAATSAPCEKPSRSICPRARGRRAAPRGRRRSRRAGRSPPGRCRSVPRGSSSSSARVRVEAAEVEQLRAVEAGPAGMADQQWAASAALGVELHASSCRSTAATARNATCVSSSVGSRVVSRCSASPGSEERLPEAVRRRLHDPPELHRQREREHEHDEPATRTRARAAAAGRRAKVTGSASAAKFVPQRGENRDGRAAPLHVAARRRSSAAAIARCSAPCRCSARPRRIVKSSASENAIPPIVDQRPADEREAERGEHARRGSASAHGAARRRRGRNSGASEAQRRTSPRASGSRWSSLGRLRHLALAERAVDAGERPEALADDHDAVRTRHAAEAGQRQGARRRAASMLRRRPHPAVVAHKGPPREGGTAHEYVRSGPRCGSPDAAREEAEQRENEDDDQDDPENSHVSSSPFRLRRQRRSAPLGYGQRQEPLDRGLDAPAVAQLDVLGRARVRALAAEGARSARSITFFAVCSAETNSITSTR